MNKLKVSCFFLLLILQVACKNDERKVVIERTIQNEKEAEADTLPHIVDDFYKALCERDSAAVVGFFSDDASMLGSDPSEVWNLEGIRSYMSLVSGDTVREVSIRVQKRELKLINDFMLVTDVLRISTVKVPFRCVTLVKGEGKDRKIFLTEFSALITNENLKKVDSLFYSNEP